MPHWASLWSPLLLFAALPTAAAEFVAPYVPTPAEDVQAMLALAEVGEGDYLIDLGAGDGRIVITAALRGAMGHGVELDPDLVALAARRARAAEVDDRLAFLQGDIFDADVTGATVVTLYLMPDANLRLRQRLLSELRPGSRVVSNSFDMGDWKPDRHIDARVGGGIHLWVVPARIAGRWRLSLPDAHLALEIEQRYQHFDATLTRRGSPLHVLRTALRGAAIAFEAGDGRTRFVFSGQVDGDRMYGMVQVHEVDSIRLAHWQASRGGDSVAALH